MSVLGHIISERSRRGRVFRQLYKYSRHKDRAEARGLWLLRRWLSPEQRRQLDSFGYFEVVSSVSQKKYRIHFGVSANIRELGKDDKPRTGWCFVPQGYLVPGDVMLARKIALETSECEALAVANQFPSMTPAVRRDTRRPC